MAKADYYEQLGVDRSASAAELKSAYRKLAKQYHPDVNPGDASAEQKFKDISEAYDVLKDDQSRGAYDQFGHAAFEQGGGPGGFGGFGGQAGQGGFSGFGDIGDIFEEFFGGRSTGMGGGMGGARGGGRGGQRRARRGDDLRTEVDITLQEAFDGTERQVNLTRAAACASCNGSGAKPGTQPTTCTLCQGHGKVRTQQGFFTVERPCHQCQGSGQMIGDPCGDCRGGGQTSEARNLSVSIPAGVEDGTRIRLSGEGNAGPNGAAYGDLYVFVNIAPHATLRRDGADLLCAMPVPFDIAVRGGSVNVPLMAGKSVKLSIPAGARSGQQFRLRGKGMPVLRSRNYGDLYVQIEVETPTGLTRQQKKHFDAFADSLDDTNYPDMAAFIERSKKS
ncbi:MAG: molecular chaperone DnaJ [PS1 clade bacterium]|uniref:Chaperone protein DnaJ n=1 Tax=PS1 clade bacterium TaxID=2175152 RepID=A0A937HDR0_9PROT|nr:molecular chaperone DnaJ [PS1 clade bacterium]